MNGFFNLDNSFFSVMGKLWDMVCLSLLWILLCVYCLVIMVVFFADSNSDIVLIATFLFQLITVGPATTALYYSTVKVVRKERGYAVKSFFESFKLNFKQGAIVGELLFLAVYILWIDFQYANALIESKSSMGQVFFVGSLSISIILCAVTVFIFPLLSRFTIKTFALLRTTLLISMRHIFTAVLLILLIAVSVILVIFLPPVIIIIPSGCVFIMSFLIERIFKKYMPKKEESEESNESEETEKDLWYLD